MKFKLIDREKKGFARYCPTFARAYGCMKEGLQKRRQAKAIRRETDSVLKVAGDLSDGDAKFRQGAAWELGEAALKGADITAAIPALAKALGDEDKNVRWYAAKALAFAAEKGTGITAAMPALLKALDDDDGFVQGSAIETFENAANCDQKTRTTIVNRIMGFMRSDRFQTEMGKNSVAYERAATGIARILVKMMEAEEKAA